MRYGISIKGTVDATRQSVGLITEKAVQNSVYVNYFP